MKLQELTRNEITNGSYLVENAKKSVNLPEVQEMIMKLSEYGLGVFLPHMHTEEGFVQLPMNMVQFEDNLQVSFVPSTDERVKSSYPVGWAWDKDKLNVVGTCYCGGADHPFNHK